jgi:hypothetical protein
MSIVVYHLYKDDTLSSVRYMEKVVKVNLAD